MENELISVIVPVYKVEPYLRRCVDSILNQTYSNLEVILVDDGSPDNCPAICDEYAQKDSRVHVIHQENRGLSAARNAGMDYIYRDHPDLLGEYIAFIDSDDWIHSRYFEYLLGAADGADMVVCGNTWVYDGTPAEAADIVPPSPVCRVLSLPEILSGDPANFVWARLYRASLTAPFRFDSSLPVEDEPFNMDILCSKPRLRCNAIDVPLYYYLQRSDSLIHTIDHTRYPVLLDHYRRKLEQLDDDAAVQMLLEKTIKRYLSTRYAASVSGERNIRKTCHTGLRECISLIRSNGVISSKRRLTYQVFAYVPSLYRLFRILNDPTLLTWERAAKQKRKELRS